MVQGIFLLRFLAGASFAGPVLVGGGDLRLWSGAAVCVGVTLAVYILNGVTDVEEDRANGSLRPVARGELEVTTAAGVAAGLAALSLGGGLALGGVVAWCVPAALVLGWLYSGPPWYLKRWPAGLAVVAVGAALVTYGAGYDSNGGGGDFLALGLFAGFTALWMGIVGQTKDLSDVRGDERAGRKSGPVAWGEEAARRAFAGGAVGLGAGFVVLAAVLAGGLLAPAVVMFAGGLAVAVVLAGPWSRGGRAKRRRPYRVFMLTQYAVNLTAIIV